MENRIRKLGPRHDDRPALAVLAVLLKGIFFSAETLTKLGYDRTSSFRTLQKLRETRVIERRPGGYVLGDRSFSELSKIATPEDLERIAEFAYDLYGMDAWDEIRLESVAARFGEYLRAIRNGRISLPFLHLSEVSAGETPKHRVPPDETRVE